MESNSAKQEGKVDQTSPAERESSVLQYRFMWRIIEGPTCKRNEHCGLQKESNTMRHLHVDKALTLKAKEDRSFI